jgi:hypothetical protein
MPVNEINYEFPMLGQSQSSNSWTDPGNYSLTEQPSTSNVNIPTPEEYSNEDPWYVDTLSQQEQSSQGQQSSTTNESSSSDWWNSLWDWVKSEQGTSVLGGTAQAMFDEYRKQIEFDRKKELQDSSGPTSAELYDARVKAHNKSINMPMKMGVRRFK